MNLTRSSGLLLHPTSLPGPGGVGTLGAVARRFVDSLAASGQTWWQILPLHPPGMGGSPYSATSAFAGNPMLLDLEPLVAGGWLARSDSSEFAAACEKFPPQRFAIDEVTALKEVLLDRAIEGWRAQGGADDPRFRRFCQEQGELWLDDFALYTALRRERGGASWRQWPGELVRREPRAIEGAREALMPIVQGVKFLQWCFFEQWSALREYAASQGVKFLGDLPIFVAMDSADVWSRRDLFELDASGEPDAVAGVPPDYFSETGQRWGNPLYDWEKLKSQGFSWWIDRVVGVMQTCDLVRVDHFRGFESYWRIPADEPTAIHGEWVPGPGDSIFEAIREALGEVPFVAEDLGIITDAVHELRDRQGLPGMKVLQFAFDGSPDHPFLPHTYPELCVAYTGTHDNDTTIGWYDGLSEEERHRVRTYLSCSDEQVLPALIERLWRSRAAMTILPVQDVLGLGSEARMNTPGVAQGNWSWRMTAQELDELEDRLNRLAGPRPPASND